MTHEEQQALFDTILRRANLPGSFNVENGIRLTSLSDGGAEGEVRLTAGHLNPLGIVHGGVSKKRIRLLSTASSRPRSMSLSSTM